MTNNDFHSAFNEISREYIDYDICLAKSTRQNNCIDYTTLNSNVNLKCYLTHDFISVIFINTSRYASNEDLIDASYYPIVTARTLDKSLSKETAYTLMTELITTAQQKPGVDAKQTLNGIEYTAVVSENVVTFSFSKKI